MQYRHLLSCFLFFISFTPFSNHLKAQSKSDTSIVITDTTDIDALFKKARDLSYDGNYSKARIICLKILDKDPNYYDVRTFVGRTYAWERQFDNARTELSRVLIEKENDYEALNAMFDVEFWNSNYDAAKDYLKLGLSYYPNSEELLLKKAKLQLRQEDKESAALTLRKVLDINPGQKEAMKMINAIEGKKLNNIFELNYIADRFASRKAPQQLYSAELGHTFNFGSLYIRGNGADKFDKKGFQYEVESYLRFAKGTYANLLAGFSNSSLFPTEKYSAEIFHRLSPAFEASLGGRYQIFSRSTTIYTLSLSNYHKDYWFNLRSFITPKTDDTRTTVALKTTSVTLIFNARKYVGDANNFFGIRLGRGRSPDENRSLDLAQQTLSYQAAAEFQRALFGQLLIRGTITYAKEDILNGRYNQRISTQVALKTYF